MMYYAAHINLDVPRCCLLEVSCHKQIDYSWFYKYLIKPWRYVFTEDLCEYDLGGRNGLKSSSSYTRTSLPLVGASMCQYIHRYKNSGGCICALTCCVCIFVHTFLSKVDI